MVQLPMTELRNTFGTRLQENISMANYTTARVGGNSPALVSIHTLEGLVEAAQLLWGLSVPFLVLGSGSNILVSDQGSILSSCTIGRIT